MKGTKEKQKLEDVLTDAAARLVDAKSGVVVVLREAEKELHDTWKATVTTAVDGKEKSVTLPSMRRSEGLGFPVTGPAARRTAEVFERIRAAMDYAVSGISEYECGKEHRVVQMIAEESEGDFRTKAKKYLKGLTSEQTDFLEQLQPYHGNYPWRVLRQVTNKTKHRGLVIPEWHGGMAIRIGNQTTELEPGDLELRVLRVYPILGIVNILVEVGHMVIAELGQNALNGKALRTVKFNEK